MARVNKFWRTLTVLGAAVLALSLASAAFAQAPPPVPHSFFGSAADGSGATLDGVAAANGAVVIAWNEAGVNVGQTTIADGLWLISVSSDDAASVTFTLDGNADSNAAIDVTDAGFSAVTITAAAGAPPADPADPPPAALPNTGTGGLADSGSGLPVLPLVLGLSVVVALGGATLTRRTARSLA